MIMPTAYTQKMHSGQALVRGPLIRELYGQYSTSVFDRCAKKYRKNNYRNETIIGTGHPTAAAPGKAVVSPIHHAL